MTSTLPNFSGVFWLPPGGLEESHEQGATDFSPLPQGAFPQAEPLDREDKAALPPLGQLLHVLCEARLRTPQSSPSREARFSCQVLFSVIPQLPTQEKDLPTAIACLFLNMWGSKFLAAMVAKETSTTPSHFLTSLEAVVRSICYFMFSARTSAPAERKDLRPAIACLCLNM